MHNACSQRHIGGPDRCPECQRELIELLREELASMVITKATKEDYERLGIGHLWSNNGAGDNRCMYCQKPIPLPFGTCQAMKGREPPGCEGERLRKALPADARKGGV